jgi:hypothetical protein
MKFGIAAGPIDTGLPYGLEIQHRCDHYGFSSPLAYAIAQRETIRGQIAGQWDARTIVSGDGGHGLYQLTSSWPNPGWDDIDTNIDWALVHYLIPAMTTFANEGLQGENLVRIIAAAFNEGIGAAWTYHKQGNVDLGTTGHDYASDVLAQYLRIVNGQRPN